MVHFRRSLLIITIICFFTLPVPAISSDTDSSAETLVDDDGDELVDLDGLTDAELEAICTDRGFELVREADEDGGQIVYTHNDYVDAATQCLAIEAEMEKVLEENPEILEELQAEAERMKVEKEKLEAELADVQEKLTADNAKQNTEEPERPAFFSPKSGEEEEQDEETEKSTSDQEEDQVIDEESAHDKAGTRDNTEDILNEVIDFDVIDEENDRDAPDASVFPPNDEIRNGEHSEDKLQNEEHQNVANASESEKIDSSLGASLNEKEGEQLSQVTEEDLGVVATIRESLVQIRKDVDAVVKPAMAILRPFLKVAKDTGISVIDMAKRYIIALLASRTGDNEAESVPIAMDA